ncbi:hypothetical protein AMR72_16450 [Flavobacterium psychrophilum]|nr:hypothetical protein AMR72_16450 [Flavobacterium psychrophilum]AOE53955.1 hypothetical protein ALW18_16440 [Flavobacterium psychrophilum]
MAKLKETTQEKKLKRNKGVLAQYNALKQTMTTRDAQPIVAEMFNISEDTVKKILFDPSYSCSPLPQPVPTNVATTGELKTMPI